jgi:hypothetical protein
MLRLFLASAAALAACTPSPQENAMHSPSPDAETTSHGGIASANRTSRPNQAAQRPIPGVIPVTDHPLRGLPADSPLQAEGRRTLSAAFVRAGPDGHLTVELRDGRLLVLRNVAMRPKDFCGEQLPGGKYCGGYADVAAARPGGGPGPGQPDPAATDAGPLPPAPPKAK